MEGKEGKEENDASEIETKRDSQSRLDDEGQIENAGDKEMDGE